MSLSNILQQVQRKGQPPPVRSQNASPQNIGRANGTNGNINKNASAATTSSRPSGTGERVRVVDPVVARLKAARKLEMEKKEQERAAKNARAAPKKAKATIPIRQGQAQKSAPVPPKPTSRGSKGGPGSSGARNKSSIGAGRPVLPPPGSGGQPRPAKKMKFNELMKKASQIDNSKLSINIKTRTKSPESTNGKDPRRPTSNVNTKSGVPLRRSNTAPPPSSQSSSSRNPHTSRMDRPSGSSRPNGPSNGRGGGAPPPPAAPVHSGPIALRKPSSALEEKLNSRKKMLASSGGHQSGYSGSKYDDEDGYDDDSDNDSFIVSDEEEEREEVEQTRGDYDRDEIWAIFNRGKKRSHYSKYDDYDSDDMEATGAEILEEELRSKKRADLEDRREWEEEQRRAELKRARKQRK